MLNWVRKGLIPTAIYFAEGLFGISQILQACHWYINDLFLKWLSVDMVQIHHMFSALCLSWALTSLAFSDCAEGNPIIYFPYFGLCCVYCSVHVLLFVCGSLMFCCHFLCTLMITMSLMIPYFLIWVHTGWTNVTINFSFIATLANLPFLDCNVFAVQFRFCFLFVVLRGSVFVVSCACWPELIIHLCSGQCAESIGRVGFSCVI